MGATAIAQTQNNCGLGQRGDARGRGNDHSGSIFEGQPREPFVGREEWAKELR